MMVVGEEKDQEGVVEAGGEEVMAAKKELEESEKGQEPGMLLLEPPQQREALLAWTAFPGPSSSPDPLPGANLCGEPSLTRKTGCSPGFAKTVKSAWRWWSVPTP